MTPVHASRSLFLGCFPRKENMAQETKKIEAVKLRSPCKTARMNRKNAE